MNMFESDFDHLISNPSFQRYALRLDPADVAKWQEWIAENPEKAAVAIRVKALLQVKEATQHTPSPDVIDQQWMTLSNHLDEPTSQSVHRGTRLWAVVVAIAACVGGFLLVVYTSVLLESTSYQTHRTGYGDLQTNVLPDGSRITLNANSTLRYADEWEADQPREVWLEGEAYFEVTSIPKTGGHPFWVHSGPLRIEVMGTRFGVENRHEEIQVVLEEGKVMVREMTRNQILILEPGEQAILGLGDSLQHHQVDPGDFLAWTQNRLVWEHISLREIATWITDHYGIPVTIVGAKPDIPRTFSGEAEVHQLDDLLLLLRSLGIEVRQQADSIILKR